MSEQGEQSQEQQEEQPQEQPPQQQEPEEDEETKKLRLEREEQEQKEREEKEEQDRIAREEAEAKLKEDMAKFDEYIKTGISTLAKTADGLSYAYIKMNLAEKEIERIFSSIQVYKHLRYVDVSQNKITDLAELIPLKFIVSLNASRNEITSLVPFQQQDAFPFLQYLNLMGNKFTKLEPLQLPRLRRLNLIENEIGTCEDFLGHPNVQILELRKNKLKNTNGIGMMPELVELYLAENEITDFRSLSSLPKLKKLSLRKNNLLKIKTPMPELQSLEHLNVRENSLAKFDDLRKISKIRNITSLNMLANPIVDEMGEGFKQEVLMIYKHFKRINKTDVTMEEINEAEKALEERLLEEERKRQEEEEAKRLEEEAKRQAEEEAAAQGQQEQPDGE